MGEKGERGEHWLLRCVRALELKDEAESPTSLRHVSQWCYFHS